MALDAWFTKETYHPKHLRMWSSNVLQQLYKREGETGSLRPEDTMEVKGYTEYDAHNTFPGKHKSQV